MPELHVPPALDRAYHFPPASVYHISDSSFAMFAVHHTLHGNGACVVNFMSGGSPPLLIVAYCANESAVQLSTQHGLFEFVLPLSHLGV